jgi:hypothetical protein
VVGDWVVDDVDTTNVGLLEGKVLDGRIGLIVDVPVRLGKSEGCKLVVGRRLAAMVFRTVGFSDKVTAEGWSDGVALTIGVGIEVEPVFVGVSEGCELLVGRVVNTTVPDEVGISDSLPAVGLSDGCKVVEVVGVPVGRGLLLTVVDEVGISDCVIVGISDAVDGKSDGTDVEVG